MSKPTPPLLTPLLDANDLARLLRRSPATIRSDIRRAPARVPPPLYLPGARRRPLWRADDVAAWLDAATAAPPPKRRRPHVAHMVGVDNLAADVVADLDHDADASARVEGAGAPPAGGPPQAGPEAPDA